MRWEDERYVRLYTRDTVEWRMLCWQAKAIWPLILRKVDRAGLLELGKHGARGLAAIIELPIEVVEAGLNGDGRDPGLIEDGCIEIRGTLLVCPNFIEAQEATQSDRQRKKESRERARTIANTGGVTKRDDRSRNVTIGHENGQNVTSGHARSHAVTSGHSVPSRAVPSLAQDPPPARAIPPLGALLRAWEHAGLPPMPDAQTLEALGLALVDKQLEPAKACAAWKRVIDERRKAGMVTNPTPTKMREDLPLVWQVVKGEVDPATLGTRRENARAPEKPRRAEEQSRPHPPPVEEVMALKRKQYRDELGLRDDEPDPPAIPMPAELAERIRRL